MTIQAELENALRGALSPTVLNVENESHMHSVPRNSETHFKVVIASDVFVGLPLLARHRKVNAVLAEVIPQIRALSLHTFTPDEWQERTGERIESPQCHGGSKRQ